jgi:hypothetical protein
VKAVTQEEERQHHPAKIDERGDRRKLRGISVKGWRKGR